MIKGVEDVEKEKYGIIYSLKNKITGKYYIGQTSHKNGFNGRYNYSGDGIERVYKYHKNNKKRERSYNAHLLSSIEKYGLDAFIVNEELDIAYSKEELDELEKKYIKQYDSVYNGYNNNDGGLKAKPSKESIDKITKANSKEVFCFETNSVYLTPNEIYEKLGVDKRRVTQLCRKEGYGTKGKNGEIYHFVYYSEYKEMTEEKRKSYVSEIEEIKIKNRLEGNKKLIGKNIGEENKKSRKVYLYTIGGKYIRSFGSSAQCAKWLLDNDYLHSFSKNPIKTLSGNLRRSIKNNTSYCNFIVSYTYMNNIEKSVNCISNKINSIDLYTEENNFINSFTSVKECAIWLLDNKYINNSYKNPIKAVSCNIYNSIISKKPYCNFIFKKNCDELFYNKEEI